MKSRAIVHSKFEDRLLGAGPKGRQVPAEVPVHQQANGAQPRLGPGQLRAQSMAAGPQPQQSRVNIA
ncbi:hypothetical protein ACS5PJ_07025 [Pseudarthrobacter sp. YS3]|uniref:hypothetical protein n=1 Tax=Pseudarthrobacter sp. YS3 TaxID=3453718 RepID=UPI003EECB962